MENGIPRPVSPVYPQISQAIYKNIYSALSSGTSPTSALQTAQNNLASAGNILAKAQGVANANSAASQNTANNSQNNLNATQNTLLVWRRGSPIRSPVLTSQIRTVRSPLAEARLAWSGCHADACRR